MRDSALTGFKVIKNKPELNIEKNQTKNVSLRNYQPP